MSERDLEPLDPELEALLDSERAAPGLSALAERRVLARLEESVARGVPAPSLDGPPPPRRRWPLALASLVLGLGLGAALATLARWRITPAVLTPATDPVVVAVAVPILVAAPAPMVVPHPAPAPPPAARADDRDRELAAERALIETARTAAQRGQGAATLEALALHAQRFPRGRLAEERESLAVAALVEAGRFGDARQRAARFHARFPSSLLGAAVDAALRSIPAAP